MKLSGKKGTEQSKKKSVGKAKKASEVIKVPGDWLYMTPQEIGVRQIYEAFGEQDGYELEIWEDAGVLEIGMSEGASVDIETAQIHHGENRRILLRRYGRLYTNVCVTE